MLDSVALKPLDRELYAAFAAYDHGLLAVGDGHTLHWSVAGNPEGVPVLYLHGGPGGSCNAIFRRFFDPQHYKVIMLDQRGCGRSTPYASVQNNTSQALLDDIEALRLHLNIERWILFGGSWGSTLALLTAQRWPERCLALCLRGVFLGSQAEIDWYLNGIAQFYPEQRAAFLECLPAEDRCRPLEAYYQRLIDPAPDIHGPAAAHWTRYEMSCSSVEPRGTNHSKGLRARTAPAQSASATQPASATLVAGHPSPPAKHQQAGPGSLALARLEAHYMVNRFFLEPEQILSAMPRIAEIPGIIIHGRHDVICPPQTAYRLAAAWPAAQLRFIAMGGHSAMETSMRRALVGAMESLKTVCP